jgi:hypothetical protein
MAAADAQISGAERALPGAPAEWKPYQEVFMETAPHGCVGPVAVPEDGAWCRWSRKQQDARPLEQLPPEILQSLRQQAEEIARDRAFNKKVDALRSQLKPEVHPERLRSIPWPVPASAASPIG